ncbi:MAG: TspO/MBR family protein [bacterium]|nr:TspO/MBR family protein [bacterium]
MNKIKIKELIIAILIPLAVGGTAGLLTRNSMEDYQKLNQPSIAPPGIVFPIVWTILFILMGIASYFVYTSSCKYRDLGLKVYAIQLVINFFFNILFFTFQLFFFSFLWTILLLFVNLVMFQLFYKCNKIAGYLLLPYLAWNSFAILLSFLVYTVN